MKDLGREDWTSVQNLFDELFALDATERARRLERSKMPANLIAATRALLAAATDNGILDGGAPLLSPPSETTYSSLASDSEVGAFTIDRLIGRGGMGEVYLAHRTATDFTQRVALKMLRAEAAGRGDLFERERRLLARLEHSGIARLIDGGIAPDGRPYMAMEYVDGEPLDIWCRRTNADLATRLRLFREACDAVAYAHASLVVHCDLKPSNILIDAAGRVRLLDFGIAKLLDDNDVAPAATRAMLTADYAAPEQLGSEPATVATDIYSLGVILFELVAGVGPWQREGSMPALIRRVLHEDPPLPSQVARRPDAPVPSKKIAGDLDAIVLKAMRREPMARYRGAGDLADDIERHLDLKPVRARSGTTRYMIGRFARRYRWAVAASASAIAAILVGAAGIAWQARQTAIERDAALAEARRSESINRMLTVMFRDTQDINDGGAESTTVRQMLNESARRLVSSVDRSPRSVTLVTTIADLYVNIDDPTSADDLLRQALAKDIAQGDPVATAEIQLRLAGTAAALGKTDEMAPLIAAADKVFGADPAHFRKQRQELVNTKAQLARRQGDYDTAIRLLRENLDEADIVYAEDHRELLTQYNNLLVYMVEASQFDAMRPVFEQADAALRRTGQERSMLGLSILQLKGVWLARTGNLPAAEKIFERVVLQRREAFGSSAALAVDMAQLSRTLVTAGKFREARKVLTDARPMAQKYLGPSAVPTLVMGLGLAEVQAEAGDNAGAERTLSEVGPLVTAIVKPGPLHGMLARVRAVIRLKQGRFAEAARETDRAEAIFKSLGPAGLPNLQSLPPLRARIVQAR